MKDNKHLDLIIQALESDELMTDNVAYLYERIRNQVLFDFVKRLKYVFSKNTDGYICEYILKEIDSVLEAFIKGETE